MKFLKKLFGDESRKALKTLEPIVVEINNLEKKTKALSDEELAGKTIDFKERLKKGETLNDILPEAFALVRESAYRTLEQRHYDVQLMGKLLLLHFLRI